MRLTVDICGEGDLTIVASCMDILPASDVPEDSLRFHGVSTEIREILQGYDMLLMTSDRESLPIALIETAAAGLPTVVTDVGGCREVTGADPTSDTAGIVVPPGGFVSLPRCHRYAARRCRRACALVAKRAGYCAGIFKQAVRRRTRASLLGGHGMKDIILAKAPVWFQNAAISVNNRRQWWI
ncbi:glycosyltransferase [Haliea sp.]